MARKNKPKASQSGAYLLRARYQALWAAFQNVVQSGGAAATQSIVSSYAKDRVTVETKKDRCLELLGVPAKARLHTSLVDIHVSFRQVVFVDDDTTEIEKSNVKVTYLESATAGKPCRVLETWHFDYAPGARAHPIYHVQLTDDHLLDGPTERQYVTPHRSPDLKEAPRVPSAPMDLPAVAELLVYDHYPDLIERLRDTEWANAVGALPRLPWTHFQRQGWRRPPHSQCWYPATS